MSTVTPGKTAPVLSPTVASMRPVETCAVDGDAPHSSMAAHTIVLAIPILISILPEEDR